MLILLPSCIFRLIHVILKRYLPLYFIYFHKKRNVNINRRIRFMTHLEVFLHVPHQREREWALCVEMHDGVVGDLPDLIVGHNVVQVRDVPDADAVGVDVHPAPQP